MKFLYISRQFNRSGYYVLENLIKSGHKPLGVLLHKSNTIAELDDIQKRNDYLAEYQLRCMKDNIPLLKFTNSIKLLAEENNVPVFIKKSIKTPEAFDWISSLKLDLIILGGGWPELILVEIINIPRVGILNTHPSLLPEFRGADVHRWQVLNNVKKSGVTIHYIDETFDTGQIVGQRIVNIDPQTTPQALAEKSAKVSGDLMNDVIQKHINCYPNKIKGRLQNHITKSTNYYNGWNWENKRFMQIRWNTKSKDISLFILASTQEDLKYNGPFSYLNKKKWLFRASKSEERQKGNAKPGTILEIRREGLLIATSDKEEQILVTQIQEGTSMGYPFEPNVKRALTGSEILKSGNFAVYNIFEDEHYD